MLTAIYRMCLQFSLFCERRRLSGTKHIEKRTDTLKELISKILSSDKTLAPVHEFTFNYHSLSRQDSLPLYSANCQSFQFKFHAEISDSSEEKCRCAF